MLGKVKQEFDLILASDNAYWRERVLKKKTDEEDVEEDDDLDEDDLFFESDTVEYPSQPEPTEEEFQATKNRIYNNISTANKQ